MALFRELQDKELMLAVGQRYRCLYLNQPQAKLLVFDKNVLKGDVSSLLQVVARDAPETFKTLKDLKSKLRPCDLAPGRSRHALTFGEEIDTGEVLTRLKVIAPTLASKMDVSVAPPEEKGRERSKSMSDVRPSEGAPKETARPRSPSIVEGVTPNVALLELDRLEKVLSIWITKNGDPPQAPEDGKPAEQLTTLRRHAENWLQANTEANTATDVKRAQRVLEQSKVLATRLELAGKRGEYRPLDVKPVLAWSWCSANIGKGALLEILKVTLPPYESAVRAFHKAPSADTHLAAEKARSRVESGLAKTVEHYAQKGGEETKKVMAEALLGAAREQARALQTLSAQLGDLDPEVCSTRGAKVVSDHLQGLGALDAAYQEAIEKAEKDKRELLEGARRLREAQPEKLRKQHELALASIRSRNLGDVETAKEIEKAEEFLRQQLTSSAKSAENYERAAHDNEVAAKKKALDDLGVARLAWSWCDTNLRKKSPIRDALEKSLPAYERARGALAQGATAPAHAAAWKALQAMEKALLAAVGAYSKQIAKVKDAEERNRARSEQALTNRFVKRLLEEKKLLESVEAELPQGRLASSLAKSEEGRATLDAWVEELGGAAKGEDDKLMVRTAMKARYDIGRLDGDMTTKALPKLYKYLGMVPEKHARGNPMLNRVVRDRSVFVPDGFYNYDEDRRDGVIHMAMPRTGATGVMKGLFGVLLPIVEKPQGGWEGSDVKKSEAKIIFSHLTLHEVGHAVDEKMNFMPSHEGDPKYGAWLPSSAEQVRGLAGDKLGFFTALDNLAAAKGVTPPVGDSIGTKAELRKEFLTKYLDLILARKDPAKDDGLKAKATGWAVDWKALDSHPGVTFLKGARLDAGAVKQVTQWDQKAKTCEVDGRVYQEAYEDTWWSYDASVRKRGIGGYQFRAPGEWFSEIYACYYGGRLKSSHSDYAWLKALVDND